VVVVVSGACQANYGSTLMNEFCRQIWVLSNTPVDPVELSRARNMLKCNVLTQLESRIILFEDIGRQIVTYGQRESPESICRRIDAVTDNDIMR